MSSASNQNNTRSQWLPFDPSAPLDGSWAGSVLERFRQHVHRQPEAVCAVAAPAILTYAGLDAASDLLAEMVKQRLRGSQRRPILSICGDRSPRLSVALLAAIKSGCAFHIIDLKYPARRIAECLKYVMPAGIVNATSNPAAKEIFSDFISPKGDVFWLDTAAAFDGTAPPASIDEPLITAGSALYVAFTSGTNGVPKAVWGDHGPVSHFLDWQTRTFGISSADRVSVLSGLAHDPLLRDVLMPLWIGGAACFPPDEVYKVPGQLYQWLRDGQITVMHLTPSLCQLLLNIPDDGTRPGLPHIRLAFFGGESLPVKLAERFQTLAPDAVIVNCYGATETPQVMGVHCIQQRMAVAPAEMTYVPVGKGIDGVQLLVLDDKNNLCRAGGVGEICIRTPFRANHIEDVNGRPAPALFANPFSADANDLLYRTGDFGQYLSDGTVVLLGRHDQQVKIRGFRVDLSEIDSALGRCDGVASHVVDAEPRGSEHVVNAFVMPKAGAILSVEAVRRDLLQWLPAFMVPEQILCLDAFPHTPNGKVDRQRLRELLEKNPMNNEISSPLVSGDVAFVLQRLRTIVSADQRGNIFAMDSLKSVEVACLLENEFKVHLPVGMLLGATSVFVLAEEISRLKTDASGVERTEAFLEPPKSPLSPEKLNQGRPKNPPLLPSHENLLKAVTNRVYQIIARVAPDALRVRLHRWRGVQLGDDVSIGYDSIIETAFPWLVRIGSHTNIGMRVTIIGHFRGMEADSSKPTVVIEDFAFIGPGVIILPNVTIGKGAVVAAGSVVSASIPPYCFAQGNPARVVAKCGVPLSGDASYAEFLNRLIPVSQGLAAPDGTTRKADRLS